MPTKKIPKKQTKRVVPVVEVLEEKRKAYRENPSDFDYMILSRTLLDAWLDNLIDIK